MELLNESNKDPRFEKKRNRAVRSLPSNLQDVRKSMHIANANLLNTFRKTKCKQTQQEKSDSNSESEILVEKYRTQLRKHFQTTDITSFGELQQIQPVEFLTPEPSRGKSYCANNSIIHVYNSRRDPKRRKFPIKARSSHSLKTSKKVLLKMANTLTDDPPKDSDCCQECNGTCGIKLENSTESNCMENPPVHHQDTKPQKRKTIKSLSTVGSFERKISDQKKPLVKSASNGQKNVFAAVAEKLVTTQEMLQTIKNNELQMLHKKEPVITSTGRESEARGFSVKHKPCKDESLNLITHFMADELKSLHSSRKRQPDLENPKYLDNEEVVISLNEEHQTESPMKFLDSLREKSDNVVSLETGNNLHGARLIRSVSKETQSIAPTRKLPFKTTLAIVSSLFLAVVVVVIYAVVLHFQTQEALARMRTMEKIGN